MRYSHPAEVTVMRTTVKKDGFVTDTDRALVNVVNAPADTAVAAGGTMTTMMIWHWMLWKRTMMRRR